MTQISDHVEVVSKRFTVIESDDGFEEGDYEFPVKFVLPMGLPGSFVFSRDKCHCSIEYKVYCELYSDEEGVGRVSAPVVILQSEQRGPSAGAASGNSVQ
jgi:hypothetical protein